MYLFCLLDSQAVNRDYCDWCKPPLNCTSRFLWWFRKHKTQNTKQQNTKHKTQTQNKKQNTKQTQNKKTQKNKTTKQKTQNNDSTFDYSINFIILLYRYYYFNV